MTDCRSVDSHFVDLILCFLETCSKQGAKELCLDELHNNIKYKAVNDH